MSHDNHASDELADLPGAESQKGHNENSIPAAHPLMWLMSKAISEVREQLLERKQKLQIIEEAQARRRILMAIVDTNTSDRFARAQTTYERRMYRALAFLMALRGETPGKSLPGR